VRRHLPTFSCSLPPAGALLCPQCSQQPSAMPGERAAAGGARFRGVEGAMECGKNVVKGVRRGVVLRQSVRVWRCRWRRGVAAAAAGRQARHTQRRSQRAARFRPRRPSGAGASRVPASCGTTCHQIVHDSSISVALLVFILPMEHCPHRHSRPPQIGSVQWWAAQRRGRGYT